jgi:4a-hydroxytetrahydrobiopterin dehydratase
VAATLNEKTVRARLLDLTGWELVEGEVVKTFRFRNFVDAVAFVNRVAERAEAANHHPDLDIRYNRVRVALVTHDAGGITELDLSLAAQIESEARA